MQINWNNIPQPLSILNKKTTVKWKHGRVLKKVVPLGLGNMYMQIFNKIWHQMKSAKGSRVLSRCLGCSSGS